MSNKSAQGTGLAPQSSIVRRLRWKQAGKHLYSWLLAAGCLTATGPLATAQQPFPAQEQLPRVQGQAAPNDRDMVNLGRQPIIFQVDEANERLEMIVNTSRILTLEQKIPQVQVNNPELLKVTPLSPNQIQIAAQRPGVTQVNMWDENDTVHTIDVVIFGDAQELQMLLNTQFPGASLRVVPLANKAIVSGHVDQPELVPRIIEVAEDYYPQVINNITVGGVQTVLLHVKVMEVSRTKLRTLGVDWAEIAESGSFVGSSISGLLSGIGTNSVTLGGGRTFSFGVLSGGDQFLALIEAIRQNNVGKILAEPDLVTVSGRPASFNAGGEFPVLEPQSLGTVSVDFKKYGTQVDFVPIVLGEGKLRLEVRPRISELDSTNSVVIENYEIPALTIREVDTAVEMRAGQTLAIAGLVQTRVEAVNRGLPYVSDLPYVGALFRRVREEANEIELLIMVTPELVDAMDCHEVPPGGPGLNSGRPNDCELYAYGYLEVPRAGYGQGGPRGGQYCPPQGMMQQGAPMQMQPQYQPQGEVVPVPSGEMQSPQGRAPSNVRQTSGRQASVRRLPPTDAQGRPGMFGPVGYDVRR